jgi:hypothetical protein
MNISKHQGIRQRIRPVIGVTFGADAVLQNVRGLEYRASLNHPYKDPALDLVSKGEPKYVSNQRQGKRRGNSAHL